MKNPGRTIFLLLFFLFSNGIAGQDVYNTLNYSNPLIYNPSYAGSTGGSVGFISFNSYYTGGNGLFNELSFTFDTYLEKIKGGAGVVFKQGLHGNDNINTTELGLIYASKFATKKGSISPSLYLGYEKAFKNWFIYFVDELLNRKLTPPSPPGKTFQRYDILKPAIGLLWDSGSDQAGISLQVNKIRFPVAGVKKTGLPPRIVASYSKKLSGRQNGLISRPYQASPEVIVHYENKSLQTRIGLKIDQSIRYLHVFSQNNFTDNFYSVGGTYGLKKGNLMVLFSGALGMPLISSKVIYSGEISLGIFLSRSVYDKIYPFAPMYNRY